MAGWHHDTANWKPRRCDACGAEFTPRSGANRFCSTACRGRWKYITGSGSTENQYLRVSGDWRKYYLRLLQRRGRKESGLTIEQLLRLHGAQEGRCALSGLPMTCILSRGEIAYTNASIDRIVAGGPYTPENVRLVCRHVNSWRGIMPTEAFVAVCRAVVATHDGVPYDS